MALDPITAALNIGSAIIERLLPDKTQQDAAKAALLQLQVQGELNQAIAQLEINKAEATSPSWWVAGWRPYVGWICGSGLAVQFIVGPIVTWGAALAGHPVVFPSLDMGTLMTLLVGMLGLSGMRTYEKSKDAEGNR